MEGIDSVSLVSPTDNTEGILHRYRRVTFREHDMRMDYMRRRYSEDIATSYSYTCLEKLSNNRFLVSREDDSVITKYTCIQVGTAQLWLKGTARTLGLQVHKPKTQTYGSEIVEIWPPCARTVLLTWHNMGDQSGGASLMLHSQEKLD